MGPAPTAFLVWLAAAVLGWRDGRVRSVALSARTLPAASPPLLKNRGVATIALWAGAALFVAAASPA